MDNSILKINPIKNKKKKYSLKLLEADQAILELITEEVSKLFKTLKEKIDSEDITEDQWREVEEIHLKFVIQLVLSQYYRFLSPNILEMDYANLTKESESDIEEPESFFYLQNPQIKTDDHIYLVKFIDPNESENISIPFDKIKIMICINNSLIFPNFLLNIFIKDKESLVRSVRGLIEKFKRSELKAINFENQPERTQKLMKDIMNVLPHLKKVSVTEVAKALGLKRTTFHSQLNEAKIKFDKKTKKFIFNKNNVGL